MKTVTIVRMRIGGAGRMEKCENRRDEDARDEDGEGVRMAKQDASKCFEMLRNDLK